MPPTEANMSSRCVTLDYDDQVCVITINRPERRNAVDGEVASALHDAFVRYDTDHHPAAGFYVITCIIFVAQLQQFNSNNNHNTNFVRSQRPATRVTAKPFEVPETIRGRSTPARERQKTPPHR